MPLGLTGLACHLTEDQPESHPATVFDFERSGPLEFLEFAVGLEVMRAEDPSAHAWPAAVYSVGETLQGWVRPEHLAALAALLESDTPCAHAIKSISSYLPTEPSTVGREAAALIEAHRAEVRGTGYEGWPPRLQADPNPDLDTLRAWAAEHARD